MNRRVEVRTNELVLVGFRREDRHAIAAGLESELARQLGDPVLSAALARGGGTTSALRTPDVRVGHGTRPAQVGLEAGRSIATRMRS